MLAAKFRARGFSFQHATLRYKQDGDLFAVPGSCLNQPQLWLLAAAAFLEEKEDLYAGWIRGDDAWHYAHQVRAAFDAIQAVSGKTGKLLTPLDDRRKYEVLAELRKLKLADDCWYCEGCDEAATTPRCWCASCDVHRTAEWQLDRPAEPGDLYEKKPTATVAVGDSVKDEMEPDAPPARPHGLRAKKIKRRK